jgi:predicted Zn-dependent protease
LDLPEDHRPPLNEDHASKFKGLLWAVAACFLGVLLAVGIGPLAHLVPWSWEKKLGNALEFNPDVKDECRNPQAEALLQRLVARIYPVNPDDGDFSIEVNVARNPVVNAYAQLGGKITLNSGLLKRAESPEEVAGVLAHEIGHVHHRHIMEGALVHFFTAEGINLVLGRGSSVATFARYLLNMDFTRSQEAQADEDGLQRLQKAHVDNKGFRRFFERMEKEEPSSVFLSDHPSNQERMEMVGQFKNQDTRPILTLAEWEILRNYCDGNK